MAEHPPHTCEDSECVCCRNRRDFALPEALVEAVKSRRVVVFAGAGVSTESRLVCKSTLYEDVRAELGTPQEEKVTFSGLMTRYCSLTDGRARLLRKIRERFSYVKSFPELYCAASSFHRELATIHQISDIITTNWDDLFEAECGAIPLTTPADFVFWGVPGRKVYKIHGSVHNLGSIVATEDDYRRCYRRLSSGLVGSSVKMLLATRVPLFVGYSFGDEDFNRVYRFLAKEMPSLLPHSYVVTLDERVSERFPAGSLTPIVTDATYFLEILKRRLVDDGAMLGDERFGGVACALDRARQEHERLQSSFSPKRSPEAIYALSYQDGLAHAFEHTLENMKTGKCSDRCGTVRTLHSYEAIRRERVRDRRYFDVAYIDGYTSGLLYLLCSDEERHGLPYYYLFGIGPVTDFEEYSRLCVDAPTLHKAAYKYAKDVAAGIRSESTVVHHIPFL